MVHTIESLRKMSAPRHLPRREVHVPDVDGFVLVRALTVQEFRDVQQLTLRRKDCPDEIARRVVELGACNDDGSPLFVGPEDKAILNNLSWGTVDTLQRVVLELTLPKADDDPKDR